MTDEEWLVSSNPFRMLASIRGIITARKLRWLTVAFSQPLIVNCPEPSAEVMQLLDNYGEGSLTRNDLVASLAGYEEGVPPLFGFGGPLMPSSQNPDLFDDAEWSLTWTFQFFLPEESLQARLTTGVLSNYYSREQIRESLTELQEEIARESVKSDPAEMVHVAKRGAVTVLQEVLGNPFRSVGFRPEWRTSTAVSIAQRMYESKDFLPMPLLADALEEAGCEQKDILNHCRSDGPHVRGCWVVDMVLGKE